MTVYERISKNDIRSALAFVATILTFGIVFLVLMKVIPEENHDLANITVGALVAQLGNIYGYYFGSSKTENDKNNKQ